MKIVNFNINQQPYKPVKILSNPLPRQNTMRCETLPNTRRVNSIPKRNIKISKSDYSSIRESSLKILNNKNHKVSEDIDMFFSNINNDLDAPTLKLKQ